MIAGKDPHGGPFLFTLFAENADAEKEPVFLGSKKKHRFLIFRVGIFR